MTLLLLNDYVISYCQSQNFFSCLDWPTFKKVNLVMDRNISFGIAYFEILLSFAHCRESLSASSTTAIRKSAAFNSVHIKE